MIVNDPKGEAGSKKAPLWLLPPVALEETSWVHRLGNDKYGPFNWRKTGVCATTYISAIMRHLNAWRDGEDLDPESGFSHIAHVATSCNILMDALHCGTLQDDRNKIPAAEWPDVIGGGMTRAEAFRKMMDMVPVRRVAGSHQVEVGGELVDYPPLPEGYDRWVDRGWGWHSGRSAMYAICGLEDKTWSAVDSPSRSMAAESYFYIEAVKDTPRVAVKVVDHDLKRGDEVRVTPLNAQHFDAFIHGVSEVRGTKIYEFAHGPTFTEDELFSITRLRTYTTP